MSKEFYRVDLRCCNCKKINWNVKIPVGTTVEEFGREKKELCEKCGCHIIKVKEKKK